MKNLAIIHMLPLERYPPVMNLVRTLESRKDLGVKVFSTEKNIKSTATFESSFPIVRYKTATANDKALVRLFKYIVFNLGVFTKLIRFKPAYILYYESYSALPVYLYLKLINRKAELWIHFHEYFSQEWYKKGMKTIQVNHQLECSFLFNRASFISQTNPDRIKLFLSDNPNIKEDKMCALPNFPPKSWQAITPKAPTELTAIKTVYVGALSLRSTYIKEYSEWVAQQNGNILFDIYTFSMDDATQAFLEKLNCSWIKVHVGSLDYSKIPTTLRSHNYQVGLILYKCNSLNYVYNAPNKLFEYLVCGLDVWFSEEMKGAYPYLQDKVQPKVYKLNFNQLQNLDYITWMAKDGLALKPARYAAENVYNDILNKLISLETHNPKIK